MIAARVLADSDCTVPNCFTCALEPLDGGEEQAAWYARIRAMLTQQEARYERPRPEEPRPPRWSRLHDACRECSTSGTASAEQHASNGLCRRCYSLARNRGAAA